MHLTKNRSGKFGWNKDDKDVASEVFNRDFRIRWWSKLGWHNDGFEAFIGWP